MPRARSWFFVCALSFFAACGSTAFERAKAQDTAQAYRDFLRENPRDLDRDAAEVALEEKEFEAASKQHTLLAYKRYLDEFPDSPKASAARALLEGLRFNAAREANTSLAWRQFLRDHPEGSHREEAERLLAEAEFKEAGPGADVSELGRLVREHPDDPRRLELQQRLDDQAFDSARAQGAFGLYAYLRDFPAGAHREDAQAELFALEIQGLLASGLTHRAREELQRSPLSARVQELGARVTEAEARARLLALSDPTIRAAQASYYLRSISDLERALAAPDPLDRWQAAEELGQHVSVDAIEPLLQAFRTARNPLIRQTALESLRHVLSALPPRVADYELASRIEPLKASAGSAETWTVLAVLFDLAGRLEAAATEYQRAWDKGVPDPVILRRWVDIRRDRKQPFSAAVAARQLALWAAEKVKSWEPPPDGQRVAVSDARELCAAAVNARFALAVIESAKGSATEFPDDITRFELTATDALRLAEARLKDAELLLRAQDPQVRTCDDRRVRDRLEDAVKRRGDAVRGLLQRKPTAATQGVLAAVREADPNPEIRSLAARLVTRGDE